MKMNGIINRANVQDKSALASRKFRRQKPYMLGEMAGLIILAIASALAAGLLLLPVTLPEAARISMQKRPGIAEPLATPAAAVPAVTA